MKRGFTLMEILIYIAVITIVVLTTYFFLLWIDYANAKNKAAKEVMDNINRVMSIMAREIKESGSIYIPTSVFDSSPGQLSLETLNQLPEGETTTYIDFYVCGDQICLKREGQEPLALTSGEVEIKKLIFKRVASAAVSSVQVDLEVVSKNPKNHPEYQSSIEVESTFSLRNY